MVDNFKQELLNAFELNELPRPSERQCELFQLFTEHLLKTNESFNLTSIRDTDGVIYKHIVDCAAIAELIPQGSTLLDVGCGAGFPSVPVAILREDVTVTALDSTEKKVRFVEGVASLLGLENLKTLVGRAEELSCVGSSLRESFDAVTARAVAALPVLSELCLPFVKRGGIFIAMRSGNESIDEAKKAFTALGARLDKVSDKPLITPQGELSRKAATVKKLHSTPPRYPRRYATIVKEPLL